MFLFKNFKITSIFLSFALLLSSCASAPFPEIEEDDSVTVLKEGKTLASDEKNIAYEGEDGVHEDDKVIPMRTKPVISADNTEDEESEEDEAFEQSSKDFPELFAKEKAKTVEEAKEIVESQDKTPSVSYRLETFYFNNGSSTLDSKYNSKIREIVKIAKQNDATINVYGFASSRTRNTDVVSHKLANFNVSMKRAESVAASLKRAGLPAKKIIVEALSDSTPAYLEVMPEGEKLNRRAEVYISY